MAIDYAKARRLLDAALPKAEAALLQKSPPDIGDDIKADFDVVFSSKTQSYREVLLGCTLARALDRSIDITLPYVAHGEHAFNGRTLDKEVVNSFLHDNRMPSSTGPYLNVFRRQVRFDSNTRAGLKDKSGYDVLLRLMKTLVAISDKKGVLDFLVYQVYRFGLLREEADVPVSRVHRVSLEQYKTLIYDMMDTPSEGRFPVFLVAAAFEAIKEYLNLDWEISVQGINVADSQSGAWGDIAVRSGDRVVLAAEVTERQVDRNRVVTTFNTKIASTGLEDYLFFVSSERLAEDAKLQAQRYFSQGHDVNFLEIRQWIYMVLATIGSRGRQAYGKFLLAHIEAESTPSTLKVRWNDILARLLSP
ncbi:restriction endonuclease, SacI family [candidate division WOR-3 bacterium]|uniref:Restriction endonuclease, SacI family n=1 Tax=candidate division WOR-3 bacterium TaxID=2052148 RepID=A0A937XEW9_UNCW3|nr:restriction endonuclease, SacI family [candidate division WOR-3 bacterium]